MKRMKKMKRLVTVGKKKDEEEETHLVAKLLGHLAKLHVV